MITSTASARTCSRRRGHRRDRLGFEREVGFVLVSLATVCTWGSDRITDRGVEAYASSRAQMCPKPIGRGCGGSAIWWRTGTS
jgi:hypothetical protein